MTIAILRGAVAGAVLLAACASADPPAPPAPGEPASGTYRVAGTLTDEGVECPAMRDDSGRLFTLSGNLHGFGPGDTVIVDGTIAEMSMCMQGTTIEIQGIERRP